MVELLTQENLTPRHMSIPAAVLFYTRYIKIKYLQVEFMYCVFREPTSDIHEIYRWF